MSGLSLLQEQVKLRADEATSLHTYGDGRLVLTPSDEPVPFTTKIVTEDHPDGIEVPAAIITPRLVLCEVHFYRQVQAGVPEGQLSNWDTIDPNQVMLCVAWTIAAPEATIGEVDGDGNFIPLEGLDQLEVLKNQSPMLYGQHMRCDKDTWTACAEFLRENKYESVEFDRQGPSAPSSPRRRTEYRLGAPTIGHGNYAARLPQRIANGCTVDRVTLLSASADRDGFRDPLTSLMSNLEIVATAAHDDDPEIKRRANSLASSLTGITLFEGRTAGAPVRAPQQAGIGEITIDGSPFNFFTSAPTPASAVDGADPFKGDKSIAAGKLA